MKCNNKTRYATKRCSLHFLASAQVLRGKERKKECDCFVVQGVHRAEVHTHTVMGYCREVRGKILMPWFVRAIWYSVAP